VVYTISELLKRKEETMRYHYMVYFNDCHYHEGFIDAINICIARLLLEREYPNAVKIKIWQ
jgi:hypothetical protein